MTDLPEPARAAVERACKMRLSYAVRLVRAPDNRLVVVVGEAHMKFAVAAAVGHDIVSAFELRGVETLQQKRVLLGRLLGVLIQGPRMLLRVLSLGAIRGSTVTEAKQVPSGYTVELERTGHVPFGLHVTSLYMASFFVVLFLELISPLLAPVAPQLPSLLVTGAFAFKVHMLLLVPAVLLRRYSWSWVIHPFVGILTLRDELMAAGTVEMLRDHPDDLYAVVVMGRGHMQGYVRLLVERFGFRG